MVKPDDQEVIDAICRICDREFFMPSGLLDYIKDIKAHPDAYEKDFRPSFLNDCSFGIDAITPRLINRATEVMRKGHHLMFGFPPVDFIRWLGAEGWTYSQARKVLYYKGFHLDKQVVRLALQQGAEGRTAVQLDDDKAGEVYRLLQKIERRGLSS